MKTHFTRFFIGIIFLITTTVSFGQFTDDFTDGDFTSNPTWTGYTSHFQVTPAFELRLNAPAVTATSHLVTPSQAIGNAQFDFHTRLDFNPSTSNYAQVFIVASDSNLSAALNGYYVQIGGASGTVDDVSLYYKNGSSSTKIIDGTDGTVAVSPDVNVRVTRDMAGNWELLIDTALNGTYISQGTIFHNQVTTSSYFGVFCKYTSTRSDKFYFEEFTVTGGPVLDIDPPVIDTVIVNSLTAIDVDFNESVTTTSSQLVANYTVNNGVGNPVSATRDAVDSSIVHLVFSPALANNTTFQITANNVSDLSGNLTVNETFNFTTNITIGASFGDVVINEIFPDPTPVVGLPEHEFIEITNTTNSAINVLNWTYSDASSSVSLPSFNLNPGEYLILCHEDDTALFTSFGNVLGLTSWPTLNNSSDELALHDALGTHIDQVNYSDSWYQDPVKSSGGWTLERVNPTAPCSDQNNWRASNHASGGTPGTQNSIFSNTPDTTPPSVNSFTVLGNNQIELLFSKSLDTVNISAANFTLNHSTSVTNTNILDLQTVVLDVAPAIADSLIYQLLITGINDCNANTMNDTTIQIAIGKTPETYQLIFTEIMANPKATNIHLPEAEYVEIFNPTGDAISLAGVSFGDRSTTGTLPSQIIFPGEYIILTASNAVSLFEPFGRVIAPSSWPSLNNSGDLITLEGPNGTIDQVLYDDNWYNDNDKSANGWSLELINPNVRCLGHNNWTGSTHTNQGTPGQVNSVFDTTFSVEFTLLSTRVVSPSQIELIFSKQLDYASITKNNFDIDNGITIDSVQYNEEALESIQLFVTPNLQVGTVYELTTTLITDCEGNSLTGNSTAVISLPGYQDVLINEILFNPKSGGSDFIELYNTTNHPIDLKNWKLLYFNSSGDSAYKPVTETSYVLSPESFVVLSEDSSNIQFEYPNSAENVFLDTDLPTYSNAEGHVILLNQIGNLNDEFMYTEDMHFELISDPKGVSLERINYVLEPNTTNNWHSASSAEGFATPGYKNSQYLNNANPTSNVVLEPKTFTPNNDGYKDVLGINYTFDQEGWVATVTIHTASGQQVNTLINNQTVSTSGTIFWDGTNENGELLATGMYVVVFRVFDLDNNQKVYKNVGVLVQP